MTGVNFLEEALAVFIKEGDTVSEEHSCSQLVLIYSQLGQPSKSEPCQERLARFRKTNPTPLPGSAQDPNSFVEVLYAKAHLEQQVC